MDGSDKERPEPQPRATGDSAQSRGARQRSEESLSAELEAGRRLQQISTQLIEAEGIEALYSLILDAAMANLHADFASFHILHPERGELRLLGHRGFSPGAAQVRELVRPGSQNTCGVAMRTRKRAVASNVETCEFMAGSDDQRAYLQTGIRAVQTTPLFARAGTLLGMFSTHWREPHELTEADERTLDVVARQLADLIEHKKDEAALRLIQQKLAAIHVHSPVAIALIKLPEGTIADVNPAWEKFFECPREQAIGKTSVELGLACDPHAQTRMHAEIMDKGVVRDWELAYRTGSGRDRLGSFSLDRIDIDGQPYYLGTAIDITERKRAEEALRESEDRFRALVTASSDVVYRVSPDWSEMRQLRGRDFIPDTEAPSRTWLQKYIHPDDQPHVMAVINQAIATKSIFELEHRVLRVDGSLGWTFSRAIPLLNANGEIIEWFGAASDITGRKRAEEALRESEKRLAIDLDAMTRLQKLGTLFIREGNPDPVLCEVVDAAIAISAADFGNIQLLDSVSGDLKIAAQRGFPDWWIEFWNTVTKGQGACGTALELGERVIVEDVEKSPIFVGTPALEVQLKAGVRAVQSTPLVSRSGKLLGIFSTHYRTPQVPDERALRLLDLLSHHAADIIERAQAEDALRETNVNLEKTIQERTAQLASRATQLRALAGELAMSEQRERQRLAQVLHDGLQQILVGAKYRIDLASRSRNMRVELDQVSELIDDAIETSRSLTAELSPPVLLEGDLCMALEWLARRMHQKYELKTQLTTRERVDHLTQDVILVLFQAARELLFNVVKHSGVNSARVQVNQADGHIVVTIEDEGAGFDPKQVRAGGGQAGGMGLFGISERLSHMNGRLQIESSPGLGSRFKLIVPNSPAASVTDKPAGVGRLRPSEAASSPSTGEPSGVKQTRIVLADDHILMRQGLAGLLRLEPDFEVAGEASDGEAAVGLVRELRPDVVLMDVSMPGMDGIEATRIIHEEQPKVRVIGLSMFDANEKASAMREAGAVYYLAKSGPSEALIEAIRACVQAQM
jgi:PAS domain S-box-containing protein